MNEKRIDELTQAAALDAAGDGRPAVGETDLLPDEAALLASFADEAQYGTNHDGAMDDEYAGGPDIYDDGSEATPEDRKRRKLSSSQRKSKKIAAQARELAEKEAQIEALQYELEMASQVGEYEAGPTQEDFETAEDFERARTEQTIAETMRGIRQEERQMAAYTQLLQAQQERQRLARAQFEERLETARPTMPDYDDKVDALLSRLEGAQVAMPEHVVDEIHQNQNGPELLYLMAGDDGFLMQLMQSDPVSAAREIGRREALLASSKQKLQSSAPAPRQSLKGGSVDARDPEAMSYTDYRKWRGFDRT